jgi:succinate dehydrogenase / fumarate reductase cytochrome b subunit
VGHALNVHAPGERLAKDGMHDAPRKRENIWTPQMTGLHYSHVGIPFFWVRIISISRDRNRRISKKLMGKNKKRPVYLNLFKIRLPVGGILSILHRATGAFLVLLLPFALYILDLSLRDPVAFDEISACLMSLEGRIAILIMVWVFAQHFMSGLRHLLLDIGVGDSKATARLSAWLAFAASGFVVLLTGVCLWNI